jgi:uncharacterized cupin superfamily protein
MNKSIINIADVPLQPRPPERAATGAAAERYDARMGMVGAVLGAKKLGYNITAVPPGKRAFPFHSHMANEEMVFVLEGTGEIRIGAERHVIRQGDFVCLPAGGTETAHQVINTGTVELKYLAVSTKISPEVGEYPDSGKFGVFGEYSGADGKPRGLRFIGRIEQSANYWEGE